MNFAVFCGHTEMTLELIKAKADVNKKENVRVKKNIVKLHAFDVFSVHRMCAQNGVTSLTLAICRGYAEMAVALVRMKADINYVNKVRGR